MSKRLENKVAVIVGATSGIGKATAELFASEGAKVVFTGRREDVGKAIEEEIKSKGGQALFVKCDSTNHDDIKNLVDLVIEQYGQIDILHNNAGILIEAPLTEINLEKNFDRTMNLNVKSYLAVSQLVVPHMTERGKGSIIHTSSVGSVIGMPNYITYSVSKAAVAHMTRSMAMELAKSGIRVNALCPGLTISEMVEEGSEFENNVLPGVPMGRAADPVEMAYGALFLASDESSYVTGLQLLIDGGLSL